jgi:S1-C subfamily serine protease
MKKSTLTLILFTLIFVQFSIGQVYENPACQLQKTPDISIVKIVRDEKTTQIFFNYIKYDEITYCIFLNAPNTSEAYYILADNIRYKLISTAGIGNVDGITRPKRGESLRFSATFEAIPKSVTEFDLIEGSNGSWHFFGVKLIDKPVANSIQQPEISNDDCDEVTIIPATPEPSFEDMLSGVKRAILIQPEKCANQELVVYKALTKYLIEMGFEIDVKLLKDDLVHPSNYSTDDIFVYVVFDWRISTNNDAYEYSNLMWGFVSSINRNYKWTFSDTRKNTFSSGTNPWDIESFFIKDFRYMCPYKKPEFNPDNKIYPEKQITCWTEVKLKKYFQSKSLDKIEGIYESSISKSQGTKYRVAVIKTKDIFQLIYLSGVEDAKLWEEGELKATLLSTSTKDFFKANWITYNKTVEKDYYISFENGLFNLFDSNNEKGIYIKLYPIADTSNNPDKITGSGSGFGISSNGYIITNHHVTNGATIIKVRGINGDFTKSYSAKIIVEDKNNDLSIIKIDDSRFTSLGTIPYVIASKSSDVGSSVFVLGYPLRASMGDEVKLTNGIISSKSGYQGDVTSYQITVPIQPGNSGGPLFNSNGNIVGIVNAKLNGAENASYAIKSSYLLNLIELLPATPELQSKGTLTGLSLPEQVKTLKKFTYIIEVN